MYDFVLFSALHEQYYDILYIEKNILKTFVNSFAILSHQLLPYFSNDFNVFFNNLVVTALFVIGFS